jgi:glycosyltransferase involved in cell wall biosynthesis
VRLAILMSVASPWSREAAVQLSEAGHEIHVIAFREDRESTYLPAIDGLQSSGFRRLQDSVAAVYFLRSPTRSELRYLLLAPALRRILRQSAAEALLSLYAGGFAAMAFASGFRPYAVYVVGSDVQGSRGLKRATARISLKSASCVFANGVYLAEKVSEVVPGANPIPLYLGVNTSRFSPGQRLAKPVRIVCTRGFSPVYNNDYLIRALARMPEGQNGFTVTFVSGGPLLESARRMADDLLPPQVRSRVEFLGGVSDERLTEIVRNGHMYVSFSRSDGTSSSLLEALASGLFPVLSDIPQNREWISTGNDLRNGILVPLDQPAALAKALLEAILDEQWRSGVAEYNRNLVLTRADATRNMANLAATLEAMVQKSKPT